MEENVKINKEKNFIIIILALLVIFIIGAGIYFIFIKKDDKSPEGNKPVPTAVDNKENNLIEEKYYKTNDGKLTLRIVDINKTGAKEELLNKYKNMLSGLENDPAVRSADDFLSEAMNGADVFAYFNDIIMTAKIEYDDDHYINYNLRGFSGEINYDHSIFINKDTNEIVISPDELNSLDSSCTINNRENELCGLGSSSHVYRVIKTELGYFYFHTSNHMLYTTSWKKLGHVRLKETHDDSIELEEIDSVGGNCIC